MNRPEFLRTPLGRQSRFNSRAPHLKIDPKGRPAGVVGGVVGAVDGGVGAAGDRARIEEKRLIEDIQADR